MQEALKQGDLVKINLPELENLNRHWQGLYGLGIVVDDSCQNNLLIYFIKLGRHLSFSRSKLILFDEEALRKET